MARSTNAGWIAECPTHPPMSALMTLIVIFFVPGLPVSAAMLHLMVREKPTTAVPFIKKRKRQPQCHAANGEKLFKNQRSPHLIAKCPFHRVIPHSPIDFLPLPQNATLPPQECLWDPMIA